MKKFTKEDIKVGSVWHWPEDPKWRVRITAVDNKYVFYEHVDAVWTQGEKLEDFLYECEPVPVYTVEGFEV